MQLQKCKDCQQERRLTQFSKNKSGNRSKICQFCSYDGLGLDEKHKILREAYRNYYTFKQYVTDTGKDIIEYSIPNPYAGTWEPVIISFTGLERALKSLSGEGTVLSKRKEQAFYLHVIRDMRQQDVANVMGITPVSVGQYVESAMLQVAQVYFCEDHIDGLLP